jgi:hypothetical protein
MAFIVTTTDMLNNRSFAVNGEGATIREVLQDFFGPDADVEEEVASKSVNIVNRGPVSVAMLDSQVHEACVITVYAKSIADGAVKGA